MKILCSTIIIALFLLLSSTGVQAQTTQPKLNQLELDMQFIGTWKSVASRDTITTIVCKSLYNGVETYYKTETKGKIIFEEKSLLGYDKKTDKLIECSIDNSSPYIGVYAAWFTSKNKMEEVLLEDITNPDKAILRMTFEFISPDVFVLTYRENNKVTNKHTFHREK
jgi:hypothetical protein